MAARERRCPEIEHSRPDPYTSLLRCPSPVGPYEITIATERVMGDTTTRFRLRDTATGEVVFFAEDTPPYQIAIARDGTRVYVQRKWGQLDYSCTVSLPDGKTLDRRGIPARATDVILMSDWLGQEVRRRRVRGKLVPPPFVFEDGTKR